MACGNMGHINIGIKICGSTGPRKKQDIQLGAFNSFCKNTLDLLVLGVLMATEEDDTVGELWQCSQCSYYYPSWFSFTFFSKHIRDYLLLILLKETV